MLKKARQASQSFPTTSRELLGQSTQNKVVGIATRFGIGHRLTVAFHTAKISQASTGFTGDVFADIPAVGEREQGCRQSFFTEAAPVVFRRSGGLDAVDFALGQPGD